MQRTVSLSVAFPVREQWTNAADLVASSKTAERNPSPTRTYSRITTRGQHRTSPGYSQDDPPDGIRAEPLDL